MIPLRESKLTRLFSGHFQGKGKAVMIANASPCEYTFDETLNVLRFSALLKTVKLNDSYISAASSSLQNITSQWAKSKSHIADVSLDQSSDFDNSVLADMQEKDEMIEKLLDLADSLRSNLEKEKKEKAQLEVTIRQDVCREYSEYSDELIENQKRIAAEYVESLNSIHKKRMENLEEKYERQINHLKSQLEEYESCTDESSMSINKGNATLNNEDAETSKLLFESPTPISKTEHNQFKVDSPVTILPVKSEPSSEDALNYIEEIKSLQDELNSVTDELKRTKEELARIEGLLEEAQTEAASARNERECISSELLDLKAESLKKDDAIEALKKEKKDLEENNLFSSEERTIATNEIEQLKKEKVDAEEQFTLQSKDYQQRISESIQECETFRLKMEKSLGDLVEVNSKYEILESECKNLKNHNSKLLEESKTLQDKLAVLTKARTDAGIRYKELELELEKADKLADSYKQENLKQIEELQDLKEKIALGPKQSDIDEAELKCQDLTKELEIVNKTIQDQEMKINQLENDCAALRDQNMELSMNYERERSAAILEKYDINETDSKCREMSKELEEVNKIIGDQSSRLTKLEDDCVNLTLKNTALSASYDVEQEKYAALLVEQDTGKADLKCQELSDQLKEASKIIEDQSSKIIKLEGDCANLTLENAALSASYNIEKDKCSALSEEHDNASVQLEHLKRELSEAMDPDLEILENLKLEKEIAQEKYNELLPKFEDLSSKISKLEADCSAYQLEKAKYLDTIKKFEESAVSDENLELAANKRLTDLALQLESTSQELKDQVIKNNMLEEKSSSLASQLDKSLQDLEERGVKINELEIKSKELSTNLENSYREIVELKSKAEELELDCTTHKNNNEELLQDYISLERKFADIKEKLGDGSDLKSRLEEVEVERDMLKSSYDKVYENYQMLDTAFTTLSKDIGPLRTDYEQLKQDKLDAADTYTKTIEELKNEIETSKKNLEELGNKSNEAQATITKYEEEMSQLQSEYISLKEKYSLLEAENVSLQGTDAKNKFEGKLNEALNEECSGLNEKCRKLETENLALQAELEEVQSKNSKDVTEFTTKIAELEQTISMHEDQIKEMTEKVEKYETDIEDYEKEKESAEEEIGNLKNELKEAKLLQEQSDVLCQSLENCENAATKKIELLQSSKRQAAEEITDLKRQIKEKSNSIAELEKALQAKQQQAKEDNVKMTELVAAKRKDAERMEQLRHEKNLLEVEISKMKKNTSQSKAKPKEKQKVVDEKVSQEVVIEKVVVKKKRSLSDANRDTEENLVNEDVLDSKPLTNKDKANAKTTQEDESEVLSKRRRVLRPKQTSKSIEPVDESFEIKEADDDYEPPKKSVNRKKVLKKAPSKEIPPPKARTSRRKLQEQENMSPVKKAMHFVGSKIMSVAQSVSNMPSPRVTRGRKKLFNADADPKKQAPNWKI